MALTVLLGVVFSSSVLAAPQGPPAVVRVDAVRQELVEQKRPVTGELRPARRVEVATREKGLVIELAVREGAEVKAGALVARLDATQLLLDQAVLEARGAPVHAQVAERESDVQVAERNVVSLEALVKNKAANPKELEDARNAVTAAKARLLASRADLKVIEAEIAKVRQRVKDMEIRAPFDGSVVRRATEVGAWLGEGAAVVELISTSQLDVWLEVPQSLFAFLDGRAGPIDVELTATGQSFALGGFRVIPDIDKRSRSFFVVGSAKTALSLAAGMSVRAHVPTDEEREMITIHRDAILRNELGSYVYAVVPGGDDKPPSAMPMQVDILFQSTERAVVRAGALQPGMQIVIEGNERLYPTAPIQPIPADG